MVSYQHFTATSPFDQPHIEGLGASPTAALMDETRGEAQAECLYAIADYHAGQISYEQLLVRVGGSDAKA